MQGISLNRKPHVKSHVTIVRSLVTKILPELPQNGIDQDEHVNVSGLLHMYKSAHVGGTLCLLIISHLTLEFRSALMYQLLQRGDPAAD